MDLIELGTALREERERQELSVKEVADQIKISRHCLEAIEEGRRDDLPHPVYAKGFIKNYGRLLGLDVDELGEILSSIFAMESEPMREVSRIDASDSSSCIRGGAATSSSNLTLIVAVIVFLLLLGGGGWYLFSKQSDSQTSFNLSYLTEIFSSKADVPERSESDAPSTDSTESLNREPVPLNTPSVEQKSSSQDAVTPAPNTNASETLEAENVTEPPAANAAETALNSTAADVKPAAEEKKVALEDGKKWVEVYANQPCWIESGPQADNLKQVFLQQGQRFVAKFDGEYTIRLGNPGGVEVTLNGEPYAVSASQGKVTNLNF